jgi:predicted regulator of Ras-like GTPase activity (Roadblock/LC7/MglB family)
MDPAEAIADLKQISTQVRTAVVARHDGTVEASTFHDGAAADRMATLAVRLYETADRARDTLGRPPLAQLEVATPAGSVFAVRDDERIVCAVTDVDPTVGLIFYDLKTCLRNIADNGSEVDAVEVEHDGQA